MTAVQNMSQSEMRLTKMSFGTLSDMVVIGALEFSLTHSIL